MKKIRVFDLVGKNAISMQSGTKLRDAISQDLLSGTRIELDFVDVALYASPFFNSSIGILLKDLTIDELMERMEIINCSDVGRELLNAVIQNAISFYSGANELSETLDKHDQE